MTDARSTDDTGIKTFRIGVLLVFSGFAINYLLERHNIFKLLENSPYPISWSDVFYPPICLFICLAGIGFLVCGGIFSLPVRTATKGTLAFVVPTVVLYTLFALVMQFIQTGADRLGECPGLDQAAASSNVIPQSKAWPSRAAVGCAVERRGMFLSFYNDMTVYGVTDHTEQRQVLDKIGEQYRQAKTHPVLVRFYKEENWSVRQGKNGATFGSRGPEKLIRIASVG